MLGGRQVTDEKDVVRPRKIIRVLCAADEEALAGAASRRLDEQGFQCGLSVGRECAEIGEIGRKVRGGFCGPVDVGIDMSVERNHAPCAKPVAQPVDRRSARISKDEIEAR